MKIGIFTDNTSLYNNKYPLLRVSLPIISRMKDEGWDVYLINPSASPTVMKRYNGEWDNSKLNEVLNLCKPVEVGTYVDLDVLYVTELPWLDTDWRNRDNTNKLLEHYCNKVDTIVWRTTDEEYFTSNRKTYLKHWLTEKPEIVKKIVNIYSSYPKSDKGMFFNKYKYMPQLCNNKLFLPIKPKSEREYSIIFAGPLSYREELFNYLKKYIDIFTNNYKCAFYGEKENYKNHYGNYASVRVFSDNKNIEIFEEGLFLSQNEYNKFNSNSIFSLHDCGINCRVHLDRHPYSYSTNRVIESAYSGCYLLSTEFLDTNKMPLPDEFNINKINGNYLTKILNFNDDEFKYEINKLREWVNNEYNLERYFQILKDDLHA